jgi:hypothetical protein
VATALTVNLRVFNTLSPPAQQIRLSKETQNLTTEGIFYLLSIIIMSGVAQKSSTSTCITPPQSLVLMKNMIRLSVSSICYLRNVFPADCFSSRDYAGLKVHQIECAEKDEDGELKIKHQDAFLLTRKYYQTACYF